MRGRLRKIYFLLPELRHAAANEADYGTEARGARSEEYCTYCYQNGGFTADCTMDEMIDFCIRFEQQQNPGLDAEDARRAMRAWYPTLKRWKQAQG